MSDFQGLMMEPEGSDDGARRLVPELTYHNGIIYPTIFGLVGMALKWILTTIDFQGLTMELPNFQLRYQTLKANHGQSVFHENINKSKYGAHNGQDLLLVNRAPSPSGWDPSTIDKKIYSNASSGHTGPLPRYRR
ncbi:hypothetical protein EVAR_38534_1 [Eumeta japonica]|uniref:Uncharacterized protein n=1 Tax=Eumeta variegata TaxID=151549 RepID=A0A4C1WDK9_EUMVA|nr:hypothetical protein EVAR_38534_1 [Eumeta japonica]